MWQGESRISRWSNACCSGHSLGRYQTSSAAHNDSKIHPSRINFNLLAAAFRNRWCRVILLASRRGGLSGPSSPGTLKPSHACWPLPLDKIKANTNLFCANSSYFNHSSFICTPSVCARNLGVQSKTTVKLASAHTLLAGNWPSRGSADASSTLLATRHGGLTSFARK